MNTLKPMVVALLCISLLAVGCGSDEAVGGPSISATSDGANGDVSDNDSALSDAEDAGGDSSVLDSGASQDTSADAADTGGTSADTSSGGCQNNAECEGKVALQPCFEALCQDGQCTVGLAPSGSPCDDGDACTEGEVCTTGTCGGGKNVCGCKEAADCDDKDPCTTDTCSDAGKCEYAPNAGVDCDDGDACTEKTTCQADGACAGGDPTDCDDGNPCTTDTCDSKDGCKSDNTAGPCDDGDPCTDKSECKEGKCVGEASKCDDGNPCTTDSCDAAKGCVSTNNTEKCDDGDTCTQSDVCKDGKCVGGAGAQCDDGNPCTTDTCDKDKGCSSAPAADGGACDDGNKCTDKDACAGGKCEGSVKVACDDGNPCTDESCDAAKGCLSTNNTANCADDKNCLSGACKDGKCAVGTAKGCDDNNPCTTDTCDPSKGCVYAPVADGQACDDGDACTDKDGCKSGACSGSKLNCDDGNPCTTDTCDPAKGCSWAANTANCDDGNKCTANDKCDKGKCGAGQPIDPKLACDDNNTCTDETCDSVKGCQSVPKQSPQPCDGTTFNGRCYKAFTGNISWTNAANACKTWGGTLATPASAAENSAIYGLFQASCGGTNGAHLGGTDATTEGTWTWVDGTPWSYTRWDQGQPNNTTNNAGLDSDALMLRPNSYWNDIAVSQVLACRICEREIPAPKCDDGSVCTKNDYCKDGKCLAGTNDGCDDNNPCTTDSCDAKTGACSWAGKTGPCDDGDACTSGDACKAGKCVSGTSVACDDKNPCTTDTCDQKTGKCVYTNSSAPCDDGDVCSESDACSAGKCVGVAKTCSDGDPCTADSCDKAKGCVFTKLDACAGCKTAADCDDGNPCTDNTCGADGKCASKNNTAPCDNGDPCTYGDTCDGAGKCVTGKNNACDDDNPCTTDSCDKAKGCVNTAAKDGTTCSDGKACTTGDACKAGKCEPTADDCDLLFATFDCGSSTAGWTLGSEGGNPELRWAVDNTPANSSPVGASGGCNLNFNDGTDYCRPWGGNSCYNPDQSAYTPQINANAATGTPRLSFWTYYDLDGVGQTNTDLPRVRIYQVQSGPDPVLYDFPLSKSAENMKKWRFISVPVPNIKGKNIRVRFNLSPSSGQGGNSGKGWFIDDLRITKSGNQVPEDCADGKDNDGDNKVDCADADCSAQAACVEQCSDGKDNDLDDQIDCKDPDCATAGNCLCALKDCDDKNPCTDDSCDSATGNCVHSPNQLVCDDGDACTSGDSCGAGKCVGLSKNCSDGDPCTADSCDKATGKCVNTAIQGCGGCKTSAECDDGNACTNDSCNTTTGKCSNAPNTSPCDSGDVCTYGDVCDGKGACKVGTSQTCDDGNACTVDTCDAKTGKCSYANAKDGAACDDGKACTTGDACKAGQCTPAKTDCPLFKYTFNCGSSVQGWNLGSNGGNPVLRWAVDNTPANSSPTSSGASGGCNLNFNDGTDYCRPSNWGGSCFNPNAPADSPVFSAVGVTGTPALKFWTYYDLDGANQNNTDRPRVLLYVGNQVLHSFQLSKAAGDMKKWRQVSLDVPNIKGQSNVRIRFQLNPSSGQGGNTGKGWFIDDLELTNPGSSGPVVNEVCGDGQDNDGNKLTDCADPACKSEAVCQESCTDGKDNDLDDKIDCLDPDCSGAPTCQPAFFSQSFDCGGTGWQYSPAKNNVAFAIDGTPASVTPMTGACTLNFNNGTNFCGLSSCNASSFDNRSAGTATWGQTVDASAMKSLIAEYWSYQHGQEPTGTGQYLDVGFLQVSTDDFAGCCQGSSTQCQWAQVNCNTTNTKSFLAPKSVDTWKKWTKISVDLKDFVGKKFKMRFRFSSQGSQENNLPGWFIDDMKLFGSK